MLLQQEDGHDAQAREIMLTCLLAVCQDHTIQIAHTLAHGLKSAHKYTCVAVYELLHCFCLPAPEQLRRARTVACHIVILAASSNKQRLFCRAFWDCKASAVSKLH